MFRFKSAVRNLVCELFAFAIIASGRVRRAKRKALSAGVITSIYFHNPTRRLFARCIQWLAKNGYTFISVNDLLEILYHGRPAPKGAVWISFDDGYKEWLENVVPVVRERNIPVTFFIPAGIVENGGRFPWLHTGASAGLEPSALIPDNGRDALTVSELKLIASRPEVTIGGHTVNHTITMNLPDEGKRFELAESKRRLESWIGSPVQCFAYPVGLYDGREPAVLKDFGYKLAATTEDAFVSRDTDPYRTPRFCVSDNISFPEAICNMVGVWRPAIAPMKHLFRRKWGSIGPLLLAGVEAGRKR